jgi:hypothetical protein
MGEVAEEATHGLQVIQDLEAELLAAAAEEVLNTTAPPLSTAECLHRQLTLLPIQEPERLEILAD